MIEKNLFKVGVHVIRAEDETNAAQIYAKRRTTNLGLKWPDLVRLGYETGTIKVFRVSFVEGILVEQEICPVRL